MNRPHLKQTEIAAAFGAEDLRRRFPPVLSVPEVVELLRLRSRKTLYLWIAQGRLDGTFRRRGKSHLFWRDRLIDRIFNGPAWESNE